jgi:putative PEP-CTERM system histidine kinase
MIDVAIAVLAACLLLFLVAIIAVPSLRAKIRVYSLKLFSRYKYDYRKEWLRFIATLSSAEADQVYSVAIKAVAEIVKSPGGIVWARPPEETHYLPVGAWESEIPVRASVRDTSSLVKFLESRQWIIDFNEMKEHPGRYEGLDIDDSLRIEANWWLVVPLLLREELFGFIVLLKPLIVSKLNFEDHDLLKTVGKQVATHINQAQTDRRLSDISQFTTYNRLSAYLMHDLSNLIAQHSLVIQNAERFRNDPDFVDDAFNTIAHSVSRMERLVSQLSGRPKRPESRRIDVRDVLGTAVERSLQREPSPGLQVGETAVWSRADPEQLATVVEHLIRNAQEAISGAGSVEVSLAAEHGMAQISIADSGCGMSPEFIRDRLFRPFDSTKGSESMGIGAYQAREYVRSIGGQVEISSAVGTGTTFSLSLPLEEGRTGRSA